MRKLILMMTLVALSMTTYAQKKEEIAVKMNTAGEALNAKKYAESAKLFNEALNMIKKSSEEGLEDYEKMASSLLADSHRLNAMTMAHKKNYADAIPEFKIAHGMYKKNLNIQLQRKTEDLMSNCFAQMANAKIKTNQFDEAIAICNNGLELNKTDTKLMLLIALCHEKANKDTEAIKAYELVMATAKKTPRLKIDGDKAKSNLVNGQLVAATKLSEKGQITPALMKITTALKYDPKSSQAEYLKISIYNKAKDYASVVKFGPAAVTAQQSNEMKSDLNFMIGAAYVALNDNANALVYYKKVTSGKYITSAKDQIAQISKATEPAK